MSGHSSSSSQPNHHHHHSLSRSHPPIRREPVDPSKCKYTDYFRPSPFPPPPTTSTLFLPNHHTHPHMIVPLINHPQHPRPDDPGHFGAPSSSLVQSGSSYMERIGATCSSSLPQQQQQQQQNYDKSSSDRSETSELNNGARIESKSSIFSAMSVKNERCEPGSGSANNKNCSDDDDVNDDDDDNEAPIGSHKRSSLLSSFNASSLPPPTPLSLSCQYFGSQRYSTMSGTCGVTPFDPQFPSYSYGPYPSSATPLTHPRNPVQEGSSVSGSAPHPHNFCHYGSTLDTAASFMGYGFARTNHGSLNPHPTHSIMHSTPGAHFSCTYPDAIGVYQPHPASHIASHFTGTL